MYIVNTKSQPDWPTAIKQGNKIMIYVVRTTEAFPSYLSAYYGDATKVDGTEWTYGGEYGAQQFNKIEADHIVKELKELGVSAELA